MEMNGQSVCMEFDTGASVSLVSHSTQQRLFLGERLEKSEVRLTTYTGEPIPVLGVMKVRVRYGEYCRMHPLYVVPGDGLSLLGRDWLQSIRLNWSSLKVGRVSSSPRSLESLLRKYDHIFRKGVGTMKHFEARLVLKPGAKPRFCRPRPVPYALREPIERELDHLESDGFVERVLHSD